MVPKIGFIGIGTMGKGMVQNLLKKGFVVFAYNRTKSRISGLKHKNLHVADSPRQACGKADVIITCVSDDDALKGVLFAENGAFGALSGKILIDCGTTSVDLTRRIHAKCKRKGADFLDAPLTGSKLGAESGTLMIMVGGSGKVIDACMPIFDAVGRKVVRCGSSTSGQKAKIALNLAQALMLEGYFEGLILALKNGVPLKSILEIFDNAGPRSAVASAKMPYVLRRDFSPHFKLELMKKDIGLAMDETRKLGLDLPLGKELAKVFEEAAGKGMGKEDFAGIIKLLEEKAKVKVRLD